MDMQKEIEIPLEIFIGFNDQFPHTGAINVFLQEDKNNKRMPTGIILIQFGEISKSQKGDLAYILPMILNELLETKNRLWLQFQHKNEINFEKTPNYKLYALVTDQITNFLAMNNFLQLPPNWPELSNTEISKLLVEMKVANPEEFLKKYNQAKDFPLKSIYNLNNGQMLVQNEYNQSTLQNYFQFSLEEIDKVNQSIRENPNYHLFDLLKFYFTKVDQKFSAKDLLVINQMLLNRDFQTYSKLKVPKSIFELSNFVKWYLENGTDQEIKDQLRFQQDYPNFDQNTVNYFSEYAKPSNWSSTFSDRK